MQTLVLLHMSDLVGQIVKTVVCANKTSQWINNPSTYLW
jgi:hypothetical protein